MQKDVEQALEHDSELLPLWNGFVEATDVPFVKVLADGEDAEYQFRSPFRPKTFLYYIDVSHNVHSTYGQRSKPLVRKFRQTFHFSSVLCFYLFV